MARLLDRTTIQGLLDMKEAVDVTEQAFVQLANQTVNMPQRLIMTDADRAGWTAFMPAQLMEVGAFGVKAVTVFKNNPSRFNLPSTLATILLTDQDTGVVLSVMDGGYITAMRTGAVSGVATRYLAREDSEMAGVLGMGVQARTQLWAMCTVRRIKKAVCFSTDSPDLQRAFVEEMTQRLDIPIETAKTAQSVVEQADVLALATTAREPIVNGEWIRPGTHINSVGSHTPEARELDTQSILRTKVVCDLTSACMTEAGDLLIPISEGVFSQDEIHGNLSDVVTGQMTGRDGECEITLFKSVGLSIQDISIAHYVYQKALEQGVGTDFDF